MTAVEDGFRNIAAPFAKAGLSFRWRLHTAHRPAEELSKMPTLTFDRKVPIPEQRLRVACSKSKRNHGKRHAVMKRSIKRKLAAKNASKAKIAKANAAKRRYTAKVLAYWKGERECHP